MQFQSYEPTQTQLRMVETSRQAGNLCAVFRLEGELDVERLERAVGEVVARVTPLAYRYHRINDATRIVVSRDPTVDWRVMDASDDEASVYVLVSALCHRRFRLDGGAPYAFCLLQGPQVSHLVFACHPAILDGFALRPLFTAISHRYNGQKIADELGFDQKALVAEERRQTTGPVFEERTRFWLQLVRDTSFEWHPPRMESDVPDTQATVTLPAADTAALREVGEELGIPLGDLLVFSFHVFVARMTRNDTVLTTYRHRIRSGPAGRIGFNENKPAFKSVLNRRQSLRRTFRQAARLLSQTRFAADLPAREIGRELARRDPRFKRITNLLFSQDPLPYDELQLEGARATLLPAFSHRLATEDVAVYVDARETVTFHLLTRSSHELAGLRMVFEHYLALLHHVPEDLDKPLSKVRLQDDRLRARAARLASGGPLPEAPRDVLERFAETVARYPRQTALRYGGRRLSYFALSRAAHDVAAGLCKELRPTAEFRVGICLPRSHRFITAVLGVLMAGGGYVPLDPAMPSERLGFIMRDARLAAVIVDHSTRRLVNGRVAAPCLAMDELLAGCEAAPPPLAPSPQHVAYVIYTSGTTGRPKGVVLERRNLAHLMAAVAGVWERGPGTRWLQFASFTFDASILGIFNPLLHGAELVVAPSAVRTDAEALFTLMEERRITHADLPPALLTLLPRRPLPHLRVIFCGGEALDEETARFWSTAVELSNCYGPTEATVMATRTTLGGYKAATHLGRPLPGYQTWLMEDSGEPAMLGGVGEICIGGDGVARGYLEQPGLTEARFVANPYAGGRLYRTGDLGRFLPNGDLEFRGRDDFQVKLRGFRIELGDIESAMADQPGVRSVHVGVLERDGAPALVGWYVGPEVSQEALRTQLEAALPDYMVPSFLVPVESFPLTMNGKVDRSRLPSPQLTEGDADDQPLRPMEARVREVWAETLRVPLESIGPRSNFFHLGGHSLLAALACNRLNARLGGSVRPRALFESPVFAAFCERVRSAPAGKPSPPLQPTGAREAPVTSRLIGLIYSRAISRPQDNTYNVVSRIEFSGVKPKRLQHALQDLLRENPLFGAEFKERDGTIWVQARAIAPQVPVLRLTETDISARLEAMRAEPLGIGSAPLWRAIICSGDSPGATLLFCIHHALFDGWSLNLFTEELARRYAADPEASAQAPRRTWFDYCLWARDLPQSPPYKASLGYWRRKLAGAQARVDLPQHGTASRPDANQAVSLRIEPEVVQALRQTADDLGITLPPLLFAVYLVWLWRISNQQALVVGYPYAGRDVPGTEEIYGTFVTMGFLRAQVRPQQSISEMAAEVHRQMIDDKEHLVAAPYDAEIAHMDQLNVVFSLQSGISLEGELAGGTFRAEELPSRTSKTDLAGIFYHASDGALEGRVEFDSSRCDNALMSGLVQLLGTLVEDAARHPSQRVGDLSYLSETARSRLLKAARGGRLIDPGLSIVQRFQERVATRGDRVAVVCGERRLSYRELDAQSSRMAASVPRGYVGISLQRTETAIVAIFAILKAGATYVPLDPTYPAERLRYFVENCGVRVVLADDASRRALTQAGIGDLTYIDPAATFESSSGPPRRPPAADDLAYVIHTSGSTGRPKGVLIEHGSVVRMIEASAPAMGYDANCVSPWNASMSFDTSVMEIFLPLLSGGTLVVVPEASRRDPVALHRVLREARVTHAILSPVVLQNLPREPLPALRVLGFGGDTIDPATADWWSGHTRLMSLYGPTEITVQASVGTIAPGSNPRTIGRPLPGYRMYLLNPQKQPVPPGVVGEICIGGVNLARGYLHREDLTHERFVLDPFDASPYALMYLTGDLGRLLPDGHIEFVGRNDAQIKLRGFRIELGEIESRLVGCAGVRQAACTCHGEGDARYLAAYYTAERPLDEKRLRTHLSGFLPDYMIPSFYVHLPSLPASPNGKLDRKALPAVSRPPAAHPPQDGLERRIASVWEDVLRMRGVGRDESFFHLGGNSLLAVRMQAELRRRVGIEMSIADFYAAPTIAALAAGRGESGLQAAMQDAARLLDGEAAPGPARPEAPRVVLLTGANGFLGIFLLAELCRQADRVECLLRQPDLETLQARARAAGLALDAKRIRVVRGDLTIPDAGLDPSERARLAAEVDLVVHCGAFVHHLHGYEALRAANVEGTGAMLRLAVEGRLKRFCYVSTMSVAFAARGATRAREAVVADPPVVTNGYLLSKWVAEQWVAQMARRHGLPAVVVRPGNITGSRRDGYTNFEHNHFWLFNKGCIQMGAFPEIPAPVEMMPVDLLAQAIAALAMRPREGLLVANLYSPDRLSMRDFVAALARCGVPAACEPPPTWQARLATLPQENALTPLRDLYTGDLSGRPPRVQRRATREALEACGIQLEVDPMALIPTYLSYLRQSGFLPAPSSAERG